MIISNTPSLQCKDIRHMHLLPFDWSNYFKRSPPKLPSQNGGLVWGFGGAMEAKQPPLTVGSTFLIEYTSVDMMQTAPFKQRKRRTARRCVQNILLCASMTWRCTSAWNETALEGTKDRRVIVEFQSWKDREDYFASATTDVVLQDILGRGSHNIFRPMTEESFLDAVDKERHHYYRYQKGSTLAMTISDDEWMDLQNNPKIANIQEDTQMYLYDAQAATHSIHTNSQQERRAQTTEERVPYGIDAVQGTSSAIPLPVNSDGSCDNPDSFKLCVVDSGLLVEHDDIPFELNGDNIIGKAFGLQENLKWFNPSASSSHGTHVTGTILAEGNNDIGVVGVIPNPQGICLMVARTFGASGQQSNSVITQAVDWCATKGAKVINLSLGSSNRIRNPDRIFYDELYNERGVLAIASAGNTGTTALAYPASLDSVMSVGAVDRNNRRADFSQFNEKVSLVAPGVDVLSTTSGNGFRLMSQPDFVLAAEYMVLSPFVNEGLIIKMWELFDCEFGVDVCEGANGKVCVISRGSTTFLDKALNCQAGGGIMALVFNNEPGSFSGTLRDPTANIAIPVFSLPQLDGQILLEDIERFKDKRKQVSSIMLFDGIPSYGIKQGTSMSTPHVAGVATKIWAARPGCTNIQIRQALEVTAEDLGSEGFDNEYGYGLVRAEAAYQYLLQEFPPPCGLPTTAVEQEPAPDSEEILETVFGPELEALLEGIYDPGFETSPTPTCRRSSDPCTRPEDCCSGLCLPSQDFSPDAPLRCRTAPKIAKQKLAGFRGNNSQNRRYLVSSSDGTSQRRDRRKNQLRGAKKSPKKVSALPES